MGKGLGSKLISTKKKRNVSKKKRQEFVKQVVKERHYKQRNQLYGQITGYSVIPSIYGKALC
jgi:hypothetical protein